MRMLRLIAVIVLTAGITTGTLVISQSPAMASCGYWDYGSAFPVGQGQTDTKIWIALRQQATGGGGCNYYAVVRNVQATGRDACYFSLYTNIGARIDVPSCPAAGQSTATGVINISSPNVRVGVHLTVRYDDYTDWLQPGYYDADYNILS